MSDDLLAQNPKPPSATNPLGISFQPVPDEASLFRKRFVMEGIRAPLLLGELCTRVKVGVDGAAGRGVCVGEASGFCPLSTAPSLVFWFLVIPVPHSRLCHRQVLAQPTLPIWGMFKTVSACLMSLGS